MAVLLPSGSLLPEQNVARIIRHVVFIGVKVVVVGRALIFATRQRVAMRFGDEGVDRKCRPLTA
ncbi:MAG: hypothetical protein EBU35_13675, partial [Marivivens sp.]|nr:hypothetical protein [Marivivens sp.]